MSWDASLYLASRSRCLDTWNYTHNTNRMIGAAIAATEGEPPPQGTGLLGPAIGPVWWKRLDGSTGSDGAAYLATIITELERDPDHYRTLNPPNGWGDYDQVLEVLREMRDAVPPEPTIWSVNG